MEKFEGGFIFPKLGYPHSQGLRSSVCVWWPRRGGTGWLGPRRDGGRRWRGGGLDFHFHPLEGDRKGRLLSRYRARCRMHIVREIIVPVARL